MPTIATHDRGAVRVITIDNAAKKNAFDAAMTKQLREALEVADRDMSVRAVVITGDGEDAFSSGHDLQEVLENPETAGDPEANAAFTLPADIGIPVIGAVNGPAYAAGFILALNCDLRIAGDNAKFCAVGARIGLVPVGGQLSRMLHVLRYADAFRLLSTATPIDAEYAQRIGLVDEVCPPNETLERAVALGEVIAGGSPAVVRAVKTGLTATMRDGLEPGQRAEPELAAVVRELPDGDEGVRSFLEKRPPEYPDAPGDLQSKLDGVIGR